MTAPFLILLQDNKKIINTHTHIHTHTHNSVDCRGAVASVWDSNTEYPSLIPSDWLLHHGANKR